MNIILPYDKKIEKNECSFFNSNGVLFPAYLGHEEFAKDYCVGISKKEYETSKLSIEDLKLLKCWLKSNNYKGHLYSDFLVRVLGFNKTQILGGKYITTSEPLPYIKFWNYCLMDWNIDKETRFFYDKSSNSFKIFDRASFYIDQNLRAYEELNKIKKKTLLKDRYKFFK